MHIVVTVKQVFDPNTPPALMQVGSDGKSVEVRSGSPVLNGYDANAVEEAVRLKEKLGAKITVLTVGDAQAVNQLRRALAIGADEAILVEGPTALECDADVISELLKNAIAKLDSVDLVLSGKASSDTDSGQVHLMLAEKLGLPSVSSVKAIDDLDASSVIVQRIAEDAVQKLKLKLPALLGLSNEINKPRAPALKGVMMAKKAAVPTWTPTDLGVAGAQPSTTLIKVAEKVQVKVDTIRVSTGSAAGDGRKLAELLVEGGLI